MFSAHERSEKVIKDKLCSEKVIEDKLCSEKVIEDKLCSEKVIEDKLCRLQNVESSMHLHNYVGAPPMMRGVWSMAVLPWQHAECHFY